MDLQDPTAILQYIKISERVQFLPVPSMAVPSTPQSHGREQRARKWIARAIEGLFEKDAHGFGEKACLFDAPHCTHQLFQIKMVTEVVKSRRDFL
jgi:hypothetical protein